MDTSALWRSTGYEQVAQAGGSKPVEVVVRQVLDLLERLIDRKPHPCQHPLSAVSNLMLAAASGMIVLRTEVPFIIRGFGGSDHGYNSLIKPAGRGP